MASAKTSKSKGKTGERKAKEILEEKGWLVASTEIQGLAGDDIFARDNDGVWWSIEVKHTKSLMVKYLQQAREQSTERLQSVRDELKKNQSMTKELGISYCERNYMVMWLPSHWNNAKQCVVYNGYHSQWEVWNLD